MADAYGNDVYTTMGVSLSQEQELAAKQRGIALIEERIKQVGIAAVLFEIIERINKR